PPAIASTKTRTSVIAIQRPAPLRFGAGAVPDAAGGGAGAAGTASGIGDAAVSRAGEVSMGGEVSTGATSVAPPSDAGAGDGVFSAMLLPSQGDTLLPFSEQWAANLTELARQPLMPARMCSSWIVPQVRSPGKYSITASAGARFNSLSPSST